MYMIKFVKGLLFNILDRLILRGYSHDDYLMKRHINQCKQGYIWEGGILLGRNTPCGYCNKNVDVLNDMVHNKKLSLESRVIFKDELEKAVKERANRNE